MKRFSQQWVPQACSSEPRARWRPICKQVPGSNGTAIRRADLSRKTAEGRTQDISLAVSREKKEGHDRHHRRNENEEKEEILERRDE
jgi:hypothetical protein